MGRIIGYVKMFCAGFVARKVLKWDFYYDATIRSVRKLHHSIFSGFLK